MNRNLTTLYCSKCGSTNLELGSRCKKCGENTEPLTLPELWERFSEIPVNDDDEIEEDFLGFDVGTSKFDVWHWFDKCCPNNLHDDLMYPSSN